MYFYQQHIIKYGYAEQYEYTMLLILLVANTDRTVHILWLRIKLLCITAYSIWMPNTNHFQKPGYMSEFKENFWVYINSQQLTYVSLEKEFLSLVGTNFMYYKLHMKFVIMDINVFKIHISTVSPLREREDRK
jgi:hypothetical protein